MTAVLVLLSVGVAGAQEITVPAGFRIDVFAEKLGGARGLAVDPDGVVLASITAQGRVVALPAPRGGRRATDVVTVVKDLDRPEGLAVRHGHLYVAETGRIVRYRYRAATQTAVEPTVVVDGLPHGAHHWTRSIAFGPDDKLYVAIGSSCDVCEERDPRRAAIVRYNADRSGSPSTPARSSRGSTSAISSSPCMARGPAFPPPVTESPASVFARGVRRASRRSRRAGARASASSAGPSTSRSGVTEACTSRTITPIACTE